MALIVVSCFGRPFDLGMIYDYRNDHLCPTVKLWNESVIRNNSDVQSLSMQNVFKIAENDSMESKFGLLDVESSAKLSFLSGLIEPHGASKYLENHCDSLNQGRLILKHSCNSNFERLHIDKVRKEVECSKFLEGATEETHVVAAIEYGVDSFFIFDHLNSADGDRNEKVTQFKDLLFKMLSKNLAFEDLKHGEKKLVEKFECTVVSDMPFPDGPLSFSEAWTMYKKLPISIRESKRRDGSICGIPRKAYLYPLSKLKGGSELVIREVGSEILQDVQFLLKNLPRILARANDLEKSDIPSMFSGLKRQLEEFKFQVARFRTFFQDVLKRSIPDIRGGGTNETVLAGKIKDIGDSVFSPRRLDTWLDTKSDEFERLQNYLKALDRFPFAFEKGHLEEMIQRRKMKNVLCLSLGEITDSENPFLSAMDAFFSDDQYAPTEDWESLEESWCYDDNMTATIWNQIQIFREFGTSNMSKRCDVGYAVVASSKKSKLETPGSMFLYTDGKRQKFQLPSAPGEPQMVSRAENEISIAWAAPHIGANSVLSYRICYKPTNVTSDDWKEEATGSSEMAYTVKKLNADSEFIFKVSAVTKIGETVSKPSAPMKTMPPVPLVASVLSDCALVSRGKGDQPSWYQLPTRVAYLDKQQRLRRVEIGEPFMDYRSVPQKIVLLVGATGSGKTTLVNGMINYLYGVNWDDKYRLQIIPKESECNQAFSQTTYITEYIFHWQPESRISYTLIFIDSPGFGDTRGIREDSNLIKQVKAFFDRMVDHVNVIGFVIPSAPPRLTETQRYVFDGILSLFGKDLEKNIFLLLTFSDGSVPPVLTTVKEFGMPFEEYFKFNNSVFAVKSEQEIQANSNSREIDKMFWDLANKAYKEFFQKLADVDARSMRLTREVLKERERLEHTIDALSSRINYGVNQLALMRTELTFIMECEAQKAANRDYTKVIDVPKTRKVQFQEPNRYVTNCAICSQTCHLYCKIPKDEDKAKCAAMNTDGSCNICVGRCHWSQHYNRNYIYEDYIVKETVTIEDMQRKYGEADAKSSEKSNFLLGIIDEYNKVQQDVLRAVDDIRRCLNRLGEIAMRPNPLSAVQYIDLLIKATKRDKREGWEERLDQLENARQRALMIKEMVEQGKSYDPFLEIRKEVQTKTAAEEMLGWG